MIHMEIEELQGILAPARLWLCRLCGRRSCLLVYCVLWFSCVVFVFLFLLLQDVPGPQPDGHHIARGGWLVLVGGVPMRSTQETGG